MGKRKRSALKITGIYAIFGALWILITDALVDMYFDNFLYYSTIKGLIFIFLSSVIIYFTIITHLIKRSKVERTLSNELDRIEAIKESLHEQNNRLYKLIDEAPVPVILHAENKKILRISKTLTELTGYTNSDIPTINAWAKKAYRDNAKKIYNHIEQLYTIEEKVHEGTFPIYTKENKKLLWDFYSSFVGHDENGLRTVVSIAIDMTETFKQQSNLEFQSQHDDLTGLHNRRFFNQYKESNKKKNYVLMLADINGLKLINDLYGHIKGDTLLKFFGSLLQTNLPKNSIVCRLSGDEFAAIIPIDFKDYVQETIDKIKDEMEANDGFDVQVSASFGTAIKTRMRNHEQVFIEAENNLYTYKNKSLKRHNKLIIDSMLHNLFDRSDETDEHLTNMHLLAKPIANDLNLNEQDKEELDTLIQLHDIGKISINPLVFRAQRKLKQAEFDEIKKHSEYGYRIAHAIPQLKTISYAILTHHENFDGSGYPFGLKDGDIPVISRILRIIDSYDTMINGRHYQEKKTADEAISELKRHAGTYYDPEIVDVFLSNLKA